MSHPMATNRICSGNYGWLSVSRIEKKRMFWSKARPFRKLYCVMWHDGQQLLLYEDEDATMLTDTIDLTQYKLSMAPQFHRKSQRTFHLSSDEERIVMIADTKEEMQEWMTAIRNLSLSPPHSVLDKWLERLDIQSSSSMFSLATCPISPTSSQSSTISSLLNQQENTVPLNDNQSLASHIQALLINRRQSSPMLAGHVPSPPLSPVPSLPVYRNILQRHGYNDV